MKPSDLPAIRTLSSPTVHPDGTAVVFAVSQPDVTANRYRSSLWRLPLDAGATPAGKPARLTRNTRDSSPAYSPDGNQIVFLRASKDGPPQLHLIPEGGGEARRLTDQRLGVVSFSWSPDSRYLVYAARVPQKGRYGENPEIKPEQEAPRLIEYRKYLADGLGYFLDRPSLIFLLDLTDLPDDDATAKDGEGETLPASRQLTNAPGDDSDPVFLSENRIGFIASRTARGKWRPDTLVSDLCSVDLRGRKFRRLTDATGSAGSALVGPNADVYLTYGDLGPSGQDFVARSHTLHQLDSDGHLSPALTDPQTDHLACPPTVAGDGTALVAVEDRGDTVVRAVGTAGRTLLDGHVSVTDLAAGDDVVAATAGTRTSYSELFVGPSHGTLRQVSDFGRQLRAAASIEPAELSTQAPDGYPVHGWLFRPATKPKRRAGHPVVLMIHGGPYTQYSGNLFDEAQVLVGAGYAVVMGNPRGGSGYGANHGRAIKEAIGTVDMDDLLALLDDALSKPGLDASRIGVQGGSYGGLMTTWLIGHSDRFTAAISERAVNAWDSFAGTSDIGWFFADEYAGTHQADLSPLTYADQIKTPTLIIHSERDFRCPLEQGQRLFAALKKNGVPAKLLIFPGEGHELSRSGQPRHRLQRFEHILSWWDEHLA